MSCFFHKWTKWSEPEIQNFKWVPFTKDSNEASYTKTVQFRHCERCNRVEYREVRKND